MAKLEYTIKTTLDDGTVVEKTVTKEVDLTHPDKIDRKTLKGLLSDIDKYEKAVISTRKEAEKEFTEAVFARDDEKKKLKKNRRLGNRPIQGGPRRCFRYLPHPKGAACQFLP